jgi:hypothetical protein
MNAGATFGSGLSPGASTAWVRLSALTSMILGPRKRNVRALFPTRHLELHHAEE